MTQIYCFISSPGISFCASKPANLSAVTGNVFTLPSPHKIQLWRKAHSHAHASVYRKFAEGKCTERGWKLLLPHKSQHLNNKSDSNLSKWLNHIQTGKHIFLFYLLDCHVVFRSIIKEMKNFDTLQRLALKCIPCLLKTVDVLHILNMIYYIQCC